MIKPIAERKQNGHELEVWLGDELLHSFNEISDDYAYTHVGNFVRHFNAKFDGNNKREAIAYAMNNIE